jgi:hypothetical protein
VLTLVPFSALIATKGHYLDTLGLSAASCSPEFLTVFPQATEQQRRCFELLNRAYVEARYDRGYKITKDELEYLAKRVKLLQKLTKTICRAKIESFA